MQKWEEAIIRMDEGLKSICLDMKEMREEREKHEDAFWNKMNEQTETLRIVREEHAKCEAHTSERLIALDKKIDSQRTFTAIISGIVSGVIMTGNLMYDFWKKVK